MNLTAKTQRALSIRGESIERIYGFFIERRFLVNRRYQRKLVWTLEEKQAFIDSLVNGYPVPLVLLAEVEDDGSKRYEVIDGMQRLNAIASFVEGHFALDGQFFDLDAMASTKEAVDTGRLSQQEPKLLRAICTRIASYQVPLSIYELTDHQEVDEVFRRINSYGRHLSRQELRQAGAVGNFADLVRHLASAIRGDVSASDRLYLNEMERISISGKELAYGLDVERMFWVQQNILTREYIRQSRDEEVIADMLAFILLEPKPESSSDLLDRLFAEGPSLDGGRSRYADIEESVLKHGPELIHENFMAVFDEFRRIVSHSNKPFNRLMFQDAGVRVPRYFQAVFLALWDLLINKNQRVESREKITEALDGIGGKALNVGGGGGRWGAEERQRNVNAVVGVIQPFFVPRGSEDPALESWVAKLENILRQSYTEQNLYDFKQGFHPLAAPFEFSEETLSKCIETLCAMVNKGPGTVGYVVVGVAENRATADRVKELYGVEATRIDEFFVVGIDHEADKFHTNRDRYFQTILSKIKALPAPDWVKEYVGREVRLVRYFNRSVLVLRLAAGSEPAAFNNTFKVRNGPNNELVPADGYGRLFTRFSK